jgi:hypothetical protein
MSRHHARQENILEVGIMPIDIREQVAILEAAVLKFHWLVSAGVMCQNFR